MKGAAAVSLRSFLQTTIGAELAVILLLVVFGVRSCAHGDLIAQHLRAAQAAEAEELRNARVLLDKLAGSPAYSWPEAEREESQP